MAGGFPSSGAAARSARVWVEPPQAESGREQEGEAEVGEKEQVRKPGGRGVLPQGPAGR